MITPIPKTLNDFRSQVEDYSNTHGVPLVEALEAAASELYLSSFTDVVGVYEGRPEASAFLKDVGVDEFEALILIPKRYHVPESTICENTSWRVNRDDRDGVQISLMRTADASGWRDMANLLHLGDEADFEPGHFFDSTELVAIIHDPEDPKRMVGFFSFDLTFYVFGVDERVADEFFEDAYGRLTLHLSMMQVDKAHQGQGYGTAAVQVITDLISRNLLHLCAATEEYGALTLKLSVEGQALNDSSLQICHKALSELEIMADCHEFVVQEELDRWGEIDVEVQLDDDCDFS